MLVMLLLSIRCIANVSNVVVVVVGYRRRVGPRTTDEMKGRKRDFDKKV